MSAIKKNDEVIVITGEYKGKKGVVTKVFSKTSRIIVNGINVRKKHEKPSQTNQNGGIVDKELPIAVSNVMLLEGGTPVRTRRIKEAGKRSFRASVKTGKAI
jgi:large subunit ribosomal protein L24